MNYFKLSVSSRNFFSLWLSNLFFPFSHMEMLPHAYIDQYSAKDSRGPFCRSLEYSLCVTFSFLDIYPIGPINSISASPNSMFLNPAVVLALFGFPLFGLQPRNFLHALPHLLSFSQKSQSCASWHPLFENSCFLVFIF